MDDTINEHKADKTRENIGERGRRWLQLQKLGVRIGDVLHWVAMSKSELDATSSVLLHLELCARNGAELPLESPRVHIWPAMARRHSRHHHVLISWASLRSGYPRLRQSTIKVKLVCERETIVGFYSAIAVVSNALPS